MSKNIKYFSYLRVIFLFSFLIFANACNGNKSSYINDLLAQRQKNDNYYKYNEDSPIPVVIRDKFEGLNYFEPNEDYKAVAKYSLYQNPDTIDFKTSKVGAVKKYIRYAKLVFSIANKEYTLDAFLPVRNMQAKFLFIPFSDNTNGKTSYSAGRYLDIKKAEDFDNVILDFNTAYAPYCAYSDKYSCPLVPARNHLDTDINAGEKIFYVEK